MLKFGLRYITWWHIAKEENFSSLSMNSFTWVFLIPCLGALAESTQGTVPIKMWSIKPLSAEKCLNILLIYFIPVDMLINWFTTGIFWTSPNEFCFYLSQVVSLKKSCVSPTASSESQQSVVTLFSKYRIKSLGYDRLILFCFYQLFMVS